MLLCLTRVVGMLGPLMHVVETAGVEKPNLTIKALSMISLLTDLDNSNCTAFAAVPGAIPKLVAVVNNSNPQARILAAEILNALSRTKETVPDVVAADYVKPIVAVMSGQFADAKLLDVCSETLAALATHSDVARKQLHDIPSAVPNVLGSLVSSSVACQRHLITVVSHMEAIALLRNQGAAVLVPLLKTLGQPPLVAVVDSLALAPGGPEALLDAGILTQLVPEERDALVATLVLLEKGKSTQIARAVLPFVSQKPDAGKQLCSSGQMGRLTNILHNNFAEDVKLMVLRVLANLAISEEAVHQVVDTGGLYDLVNHIAGSSVSMQTAYLSVLQAMLHHKYCISKATDAGAIQALVPLATPPSPPVIRQMALSCLEIMCTHESEVRVLVVGVATAATVVSFFLQEAEGLRLARRLLEDPVTNADLMEAGIFGALLRLLTQGSSAELRSLAASALALCIQQNTTVDTGYIMAIAELMRANGPEVGAELLAAFSAQPVYRQFIVQQGLVPALVGLLLGGSQDALRHAVLTLANIAYEEMGSAAILQEGGVSVLVGLINHPVEQVQGCSLLALGNLARSPACRTVVLRDGGGESILERFSTNGLSVVVENYCLWALRMLVMERGVPEMLAGLQCLPLIFPKLAVHISQNPESKPHALGFCSVMCGVPAFCMALSSFAVKQDLLVGLLIEAGPGREWALQEVQSLPVGVLLQAPGFTEALNALLTSPSVADQRAGLGLCEQALNARPEENLRMISIPLLVRLLPSSIRVLALVCAIPPGRVALRATASAIPAIVDQLLKNKGVAGDAAVAVSHLCRDAENAPLMVKLGVVSHFAVSGDGLCLEALSHLCVYPECRTMLLAVPQFVSSHLLPMIASSPGSPPLLAILMALLREPTFKACPGICKELLLMPNSSEVTVLDALLVLPPQDLFAEGAFDRAVEMLNNASNSMVVRMKAVMLLKRLSLQCGDRIAQIPDIVQTLLQFANNSMREGAQAALFLLDLVLRGGCAVFLSQGGVAVLLKAAREDLYAPIVQILQKAIADPAFDKSTIGVIVDFCERVLSAESPTGVGLKVAQFLTLQLLKELYLLAPELVSPVISSPAVVARVTSSPLLLETLRFFFQT